VIQPGVGDALPRVRQVSQVVHGVEIPDRGDPVLLEHLRVERDDVGRLTVEPDDVHATSEGLEDGIRTHSSPERIHHVEGVFVAVQVQALIAGSAPGLKMSKPGMAGRFNRRQEVSRENAGAVDRLKAVPKRGVHYRNPTFGHGLSLSSSVRSDGGEHDGDFFTLSARR